VGLRNIRERLAVLYPARSRIDWRRDATQFRIEITLPAEQETLP